MRYLDLQNAVSNMCDMTVSSSSSLCQCCKFDHNSRLLCRVCFCLDDSWTAVSGWMRWRVGSYTMQQQLSRIRTSFRKFD